HGVVQGVEASQGDELELEAHCAQLVLELGDLVCLEVCGPVEGRGAVVGQQLVWVLLADCLGELLSQFEVRGAGLHPDEVSVRSVCLRTSDAWLDAVLDVVEALSGAAAGQERLVAVIDVGGQQGCSLGVGTCDDQGRGVSNVSCQASGGQGTNVLPGRDQDLAAQVATLLLGSELVLPVGASGASLDHGLLQLVDVQSATEAGLTVSDDRDEPVLDGVIALDASDLVGTHQSVVDALNNVRHGVCRVQGLVRVGVAREVGVTCDLPTGEVDSLQASADLLDSLVTGQCAQ